METGSTSGRTNALIAERLAALEEPTPKTRKFQVFVSHAWQSQEIEKIVDEFIAVLKERLRALPPARKADYSVELWFDRENMPDTAETFNAATVAQCQKSDAALFLLSDRWYSSAGCKAEADCFKTNGAYDHDRILKIQVTGNRAAGDPALISGPVYPERWDDRFSTLTQLWAEGNSHQRDQFVTYVRDAICRLLETQPPIPAQRGGPHFEVDAETGAITPVSPASIDQEGNNVGRLRSLHPELKASPTNCSPRSVRTNSPNCFAPRPAIASKSAARWPTWISTGCGLGRNAQRQVRCRRTRRHHRRRWRRYRRDHWWIGLRGQGSRRRHRRGVGAALGKQAADPLIDVLKQTESISPLLAFIKSGSPAQALRRRLAGTGPKTSKNPA